MTISRFRASLITAITASLALTLPSCVDEPANTPAKVPDATKPVAKDPSLETPVKDPVKAADAVKTPAAAAKKKYEYTSADKTMAKGNWMVCGTCHGNKGKGDGIAGLALDPKPRAFTDQEWQKKTDDARIFKVIKEGGKSVGLSEQMVGYPHLSDGAIWALVEMVRKYRK